MPSLDTPISLRQFSSHWTVSWPFDRVADGRTDARDRQRIRRHGGRRDAARPAESRSALVRHRALEKLQQPSDIPVPHSFTHRPSRIHVRGYTAVCVNSYVPRSSVCVPHPFVSPYMCMSDRNTHTDVNAIPTTVLQRQTSRAHRGLVGGVRSGARAHQRLAPFLHRYPPPPPLPAHRHAFHLSLKPDRTARDHPFCARGAFSP